jgi:hypothetical protein
LDQKKISCGLDRNIAIFPKENRAEITSKARSKELIVIVSRFHFLKQAPSQKWLQATEKIEHTEMERNVPKKLSWARQL